MGAERSSQQPVENTAAVPKLGVGLAYQAPLRPLISTAGELFDFLEVVPDIMWTDRGIHQQPRYVDDESGLAFLRQVKTEKPIIPHSIGLSIGSAHRFNREHIDQLARWHEWLHFPWHSDHLSYCLTAIRLLQMTSGTSSDTNVQDAEMNVGLTLPLPRDRDTIELLIPRITEVQSRIPARFLLENNVYFFDVPNAEFDEAAFLNAICEATGCGLLLDLHNLYVNSRNLDIDPMHFLDELNLDFVVELHVAGGMEYDGFYLDAHSGPVPEPVWDLVSHVLPQCHNLGGIVFELFGSWFPTMGEERVAAELHRMKELWHRHQPELRRKQQ